jgi:hypothetical protein
MPDPIAVRFRDCSCPGSPHPDGDVAYLRPYLDYPGGAEALAALRAIADKPSRVAEVLGPIFIRRGVVSWNVVDEDGDPVPVTSEALDELRWEDAYELADRADDLYGGQVLAPLVKKTNESMKTGRTNVSTSRPRPRSPKVPTPSPPSS